jgi:hypothetical protein
MIPRRDSASRNDANGIESETKLEPLTGLHAGPGRPGPLLHHSLVVLLCRHRHPTVKSHLRSLVSIMPYLRSVKFVGEYADIAPASSDGTSRRSLRCRAIQSHPPFRADRKTTVPRSQRLTGSLAISSPSSRPSIVQYIRRWPCASTTRLAGQALRQFSPGF